MDTVTTAALRGTGIGVRLGGTTLLSDVDITLAHGEWLGVIGPNGAGKSTLLRALTGLVHHSGEVELDGVSTRTLRRRALARAIALVAQKPAVPPGSTVTEYVLLGRTPHLPPLRREGGRDLAVVGDILRRLDLADFADRILTTMSGGELQRAFLARALAQEAPILLLDEPTSALDVGHQQDVLELIDQLRRDTGLTVLATMHDLALAAQYADRLILLDHGRVIASGAPTEVLTAERVSAVYGASVRILPAGDGHSFAVVPDRAGR